MGSILGWKLEITARDCRNGTSLHLTHEVPEWALALLHTAAIQHHGRTIHFSHPRFDVGDKTVRIFGEMF